MDSKLIINFTPTGMIPTREMTPHVPLTPAEIIADVVRCAKLGASIVHLHARDEGGRPTPCARTFAEIIGGIRRARPDLVICVSTSGRNVSDFERRSAVLSLEAECRPDMASLTLSSLNFHDTASANSPEMIQALAAKMGENGVKPELEVFDLGMVNYAKYLIRKQLLRPPHYFNLLFGNIASAQGDLASVGHLVRELPENSVWALAGLGRWQHRMTSLGVVSGGHVRVGLEDNIYWDEARTRLATNEELVGRAADVARAFGRELATPTETRRMLGLPEPAATLSHGI